ncbi:MAG: hypothetical protein SGI86_20410 [Deltaproteobacteria bacterium]|nr:hypothetical protein [Deltaproteobacteria bacterium]
MIARHHRFATRLATLVLCACSSGGEKNGVATPDATSSGLRDCPAFTPGNNLAVCTATYLTGPGEDTAGGVAIANDGAVLYVGTLATDYPGAKTVDLPGGNAGLLRLTADGRKVQSVARLGTTATDIDVQLRSGHMVVAGDFGVQVLNPTGDGSLFAWKEMPTHKVAAGSDGTFIALSGKTIIVLDNLGKEKTRFDVATNREVSDIAIDGQNQLIFATGFKQDDGAPCTQLQIPFVRAYDYSGTLKWKNYDWARTEVGSECADSRGIALAFGADGQLYYVGESHGGNTVHRRMPRDIATFAPNVKTDAYNDAYNMNGAAPVGYVARLNPSTGEIAAGQIFLTRLGNGKGNAARPNAIAANEQGTILIGGSAACCIENATMRTVNGQAAMPEGTYAGGGFALILQADFKQRLTWTTWNGARGGGATPVGVAARGGAMAIGLHHAPTKDSVAISVSEAPLITDHPIAATGGGTSDAFLSVWKAP